MRPAAIIKKDLAELSAIGFEFRFQRKKLKGFVVRKEGKYYAYQNECRHLPVALDLDGGDFFTFDRKQLQCHGHGAVYEIETGLCVGGPCKGDRLIPLRVEEEPNRLLIYPSENLPQNTPKE